MLGHLHNIYKHILGMSIVKYVKMDRQMGLTPGMLRSKTEY